MHGEIVGNCELYIAPILLCLLTNSLFAQSPTTNWSIRTSLGIASEQNLGDTGLRLSAKASRHFGPWSAFAQVGTFQMLQSNENWTGDEAYHKWRSLSTANLDLGVGFAFLNKSRVRMGAGLAGAYRAGRQPKLSTP